MREKRMGQMKSTDRYRQQRLGQISSWWQLRIQMAYEFIHLPFDSTPIRITVKV